MKHRWKLYFLGFAINTMAQAFGQLPRGIQSAVGELPVVALLSQNAKALLGVVVVVFGVHLMTEGTPRPLLVERGSGRIRWFIAILVVAMGAVFVSNKVVGLIVAAVGPMGAFEGVAVGVILAVFLFVLGPTSVYGMYFLSALALRLRPCATVPATEAQPVARSVCQQTAATGATRHPAGRLETLAAGLTIAGIFIWYAARTDKGGVA